jgi:6-pyruvoyltetrahydropterin/6-carboxytetrahydropterin synthase
MFTLGVSDHVMVAHSIADPVFGPAQRLHGATYAIDLQIRVHTLNRHNVVMDIGILRAILRAILDQFDYSNLDDHPAFAGMISTTERVAEHVANRVVERIGQLEADRRPVSGGTVNVVVKESPVAYAGYERPL